MRALVTGAAGFIGSSLVDRLLADGHQVVGVDNLRTGIAANLESAFRYNIDSPRRFTLVEVDILAPDLIQIVAGVNPGVIFHLAAHVDEVGAQSDPQFDARCNILGTLNLCEASRRAGVRRIVYAASGESRCAGGVIDPLTPHAVAKAAAEMYLHAYGEMYGLAPICLALANVYGPRQRQRGADVTGRPMTVHRASAVTHDYVYIDDVVDAFVRAGQAPLDETGTYDIGSGRPVGVPAVGSETHAAAFDPTKARDRLGWTPAVGLAEGIQRTARWLRANPAPERPALAGAPDRSQFTA